MNDFISILWLAVEIITVFAIGRIIARSGFSLLWILVPMVPIVLTVILYVREIHGLGAFGQSGGIESSRLSIAFYVDALVADNSFSFNNGLGALFYADLICTVASWLMFVVFAFSSWPVEQFSREPRLRKVERPVPAAFTNVAADPPPDLDEANAMRFGRPATASPSASAPTAPQFTPETRINASTLQYCQWCGREQAVNALAIHHCGPKNRPAAYCSSCGTPFALGATSCASCAVSV
ncbi:MAG: hypothetical protein ABSE75_04280 [Acidimicrobiales bacterium]|jgi:hypothetical protein